MSQVDFLFELGCEELPAGSLAQLATTLAEQTEAALQAAKLNPGQVQWLATPRRLAVWVQGLDTQQPTQSIERKGPAKQAAFDAEGNPSKAAEGFARSCGVTVAELEERETAKGVWLYYSGSQPGQQTADLLPSIITQALDKLPIPKRMRWGAGSAQFLRPVRWAVALLGEQTLAFEVYGKTTGNTTYGHRFHHPEGIALQQPADYVPVLRAAKVEPDFVIRRDNIHQQILAKAAEIGGEAIIDDALLDEVTGLVELPVVVAGNFDEEFLTLPNEVLILTLQEHQRYFTVKNVDGQLLNWFITFSNLDSRDIAVVANGNERVVRPRLSDAMFFWENDAKQTLAARQPKLADVVFQRDLGSMADKAKRVGQLAGDIARLVGGDVALVQRAAQLARCDLLTEVVYEMPEVQGTIGKYYAQRDGEPAEVAEAMEEQYLPRFAGDALPQTTTGMALAIAEKLDTIAGIFSIGKKPTGDKDPFALRRAALGVLRIMAAAEWSVSLSELLEQAVALQPDGKQRQPNAAVIAEVHSFFVDRLRAWQLDEGVRADVFAAVAELQPSMPLDFMKRIQAVTGFQTLEAAPSLAAANKRTQNILKKTAATVAAVDSQLFTETAEQELYARLPGLQEVVGQFSVQGDYVAALNELASVREAVDRFFDDVMVMAEDEAVRNNRLALLTELKVLFTQVADISLLQQ